SQPLDLTQERLLHAELTTELHERGDAVSQHLGEREGREQPVAGVGIRVGRSRVARIAAHPAALARDTDVEERLTEEIGATGVGDEPMRGSMARMDVCVDESRAHQLAARVDLDL